MTDEIERLEGEVQKAHDSLSKGRPLSDFIRAVNTLTFEIRKSASSGSGAAN